MVELKGTLLIIPCVAQNVKVHPLNSLPAKCSVSILLHTLHIRLKKKNLKKKKRKITLTAHDWFGPVFHCHVETRETKCEDIAQPIINTPHAEISTYLNVYDNIQFFIYLFFTIIIITPNVCYLSSIRWQLKILPQFFEVLINHVIVSPRMQHM